MVLFYNALNGSRCFHKLVSQPIRAVFTLVSKLIRVCFGFGFRRSTTGLKTRAIFSPNQN